MKKPFLYILATMCCLHMWTYAQPTMQDCLHTINSEAYFSFENLNRGYPTAVFTPLAYIRDSPNKNGNIIDTLPIGSPLVLDMMVDSSFEERDGKRFNWYYIHYPHQNTERKGCIWGGDLAFGLLTDSKHAFLYAIKAVKHSQELVGKNTFEQSIETVQLKVLNNQKHVVDSVQWNLDLNHTYTHAQVCEGIETGLKHVKTVVKMVFPTMSDGLTDYTLYALWDGKHLHPLPEVPFMGAPGYLETSYALFPKNKGGKPQQIIVRQKVEKMDLNKQVFKTQSHKTTSVWMWNGSQLKRKMGK